MRIVFLGFPHLSVYSRPGMDPWYAGEVREVEDTEAAGLTEEFGAAFAAAEEPPGGPWEGGPGALTIDDLRAMCDEHGITYGARAGEDLLTKRLMAAGVL